MKQSQLKGLMKEYCIQRCELDDIFAFVADLLYIIRKELEEDEPYAVRAIEDLRTAACVVDDLIDYIKEIEEESDEIKIT